MNSKSIIITPTQQADAQVQSQSQINEEAEPSPHEPTAHFTNNPPVFTSSSRSTDSLKPYDLADITNQGRFSIRNPEEHILPIDGAAQVISFQGSESGEKVFFRAVRETRFVEGERVRVFGDGDSVTFTGDTSQEIAQFRQYYIG